MSLDYEQLLFDVKATPTFLGHTHYEGKEFPKAFNFTTGNIRTDITSIDADGVTQLITEFVRDLTANVLCFNDAL